MKTKKTQEKRKVENLEKEIWKIVPTTNRYFASNLGRVKKVNKRGEFICKNVLSTNKTKLHYMDNYITLENGEHVRVRNSRIIAKTWLDRSLPLLFTKTDRRVVDHIDVCNTEYSGIDNIRILKNNGENIRKAFYEQKEGMDKKMGFIPHEAVNLASGEHLYFVSGGDLMKHFGITNHGQLYLSEKNHYTYKQN